MYSLTPGREVALKQTAQQSSTYAPENPEKQRDSYVAGNAVDKDPFSYSQTDPAKNRGPIWWSVTFSQPVNIFEFDISSFFGKIFI